MNESWDSDETVPEQPPEEASGYDEQPSYDQLPTEEDPAGELDEGAEEAVESPAEGYEPEPVAAEEEAVAEEPVAEEEVVAEDPVAAEQPLSAEDAVPGPVDQAGEPFIFEEDRSSWCRSGLPSDWVAWEPPAEPDPQSFTDYGCSSDWGAVEPAWAQEGDQPFTVAEPEQTLAAEQTGAEVGPGHALDAYWADQGDTNYCVLYSARSVLSELYGFQVDPNEMVQRSHANGWLVRDAGGEVTGVLPEHFDDLLASYGVPSTNREGEEGAWQSLNDALANNQRVILSLDGKEVDAQGNVGDVAGGLDSDHAVALTGIDYAREVAIVNDSARGAGLEVPLDVFYESWRDSDFAMTVTDLSAPGGEQAEPPGGAESPQPDAPGFAALPMTLHPTIEPEVRFDGLMLDDAPAEGEAAVGPWWSAAASPEDCCVVSDSSGEAMELVDAAGESHALPGVDLNGDGLANLTALDANADGGVDTWLCDGSASGRADLLWYDTDGDGRPDAFCTDPEGTGDWSEPRSVDAIVAEAAGDGGAGAPEISGDPEAASPVAAGVLCGLLQPERAGFLAGEDTPREWSELGDDGEGGEGILSFAGGGVGKVIAFVAGLLPGDGLEGLSGDRMALVSVGPGDDPGIDHAVVAPAGCAGAFPSDVDGEPASDPSQAPGPGEPPGPDSSQASGPADPGLDAADEPGAAEPPEADSSAPGPAPTADAEPSAQYGQVRPEDQAATQRLMEQSAINQMNTQTLSQINGQMHAAALNSTLPTGVTASYSTGANSVQYSGPGGDMRSSVSDALD